eukprot:364359-Chlamydomonas_euryale.AAC.3
MEESCEREVRSPSRYSSMSVNVAMGQVKGCLGDLGERGGFPAVRGAADLGPRSLQIALRWVNMQAKALIEVARRATKILTKYESIGPECWRAWCKWLFTVYPALTPQSSGRVASKERTAASMNMLKRSGNMGHP